MKLGFTLFCIFTLFGLVFASSVFAVEESTSILMHAIPTNPGAGEEVTLTLKSYAEDLEGVLITWFVNGSGVSSGVGKKSLTIKAPTEGLESVVVAKMAFPNLETQVTYVLKPTSTILLWEAVDSYVPPFYKGKALASPDSFVKVVALPEISVGGRMIDPKTMTYAWELDFNKRPDDSGYGKDFMLFRNDYLEDSNNIGVSVTTTDQKYSSEKRIDIGMTNPIISFYKINPELGVIWEKALGNNHIISSSETIFAAPYYINPKDIRKPSLVFNWSINDTQISVPYYNKNIMPLRIEQGASGTSLLKLEIESTDKIFQTAEKTISVEF
jgi:hypothetical protein